MAVPITYTHVSEVTGPESRATNLSNISSNNGRFRKCVENIIEPGWKMSLAILSKIHPGDRAQLDAKRLKEDGENVRHENDEEESKAVGSSSSNVGSIVT